MFCRVQGPGELVEAVVEIVADIRSRFSPRLFLVGEICLQARSVRRIIRPGIKRHRGGDWLTFINVDPSDGLAGGRIYRVGVDVNGRFGRRRRRLIRTRRCRVCCDTGRALGGAGGGGSSSGDGANNRSSGFVLLADCRLGRGVVGC